MPTAEGTRDRLSIERTAMAADRTLMAWVRTSTGLISFGFSIYKIFHSYLASQESLAFRPHGPRRLGLFLIAMGTAPLLLALVQHWSLMRRLGRTGISLALDPVLLLGSVMAGFGLLLLVTLLVHVEIF